MDENGNLQPGDDGYVAPVIPPAQQDPPNTESGNPQAAINDPEYTHAPNPGGGLPPEDHPVTDSDFVAHPESGIDDTVMQEHAEQTVEKAGRPAGFNEFYAGSHIVNPDNPLMYHLPSPDYEINKNKENR